MFTYFIQIPINSQTIEALKNTYWVVGTCSYLVNYRKKFKTNDHLQTGISCSNVFKATISNETIEKNTMEFSKKISLWLRNQRLCSTYYVLKYLFKSCFKDFKTYRLLIEVFYWCYYDLKKMYSLIFFFFFFIR